MWMAGVEDMVIMVVTAIVMLMVTIVPARLDTVEANDYLTFNIDCKDHGIKVRVVCKTHGCFLNKLFISDSHSNSGSFF